MGEVLKNVRCAYATPFRALEFQIILVSYLSLILNQRRRNVFKRGGWGGGVIFCPALRKPLLKVSKMPEEGFCNPYSFKFVRNRFATYFQFCRQSKHVTRGLGCFLPVWTSGDARCV